MNETEEEKVERLAWQVLAEAAELLGPDVYRPVAARCGDGDPDD